MSVKISDAKKIINEYRKNIPFICELKLTENCNMRCEYCYRKNHFSNKIDPQMVINFFDELSEYYPGKMVCSFHGGEPLLAFNELKIIVENLSSKRYSNRIMYTIQTNGTLITDEMIDFICKHNIGVGVSVDAASDLSRKYINKNGAFADIEHNIHRMIRRNIDISTTCVVTSKNIYHLERYFLWCNKIGVKSISFNFARVPSVQDKTLRLVPDVEKYSFVMKKLLNLQIKTNSLNQNKTFIFEFANITNKIMNPFFDCFVCNAPCKAGDRLVCLNVDGLIEKCDCVSNVKDNTIGIFNKGNLSKLLSEAKKTNCIISHSDIEECKSCDIKDICTYGCKAENIIFYADAYRKHPGKLCSYYKELIPHIINVLEKGVNPELLLG